MSGLVFLFVGFYIQAGVNQYFPPTHQNARRVTASLCGVSQLGKMRFSIFPAAEKPGTGVGTYYFMPEKVRRSLRHSSTNGLCPSFYCEGYFLEALRQIKIFLFDAITVTEYETFQHQQTWLLFWPLTDKAEMILSLLFAENMHHQSRDLLLGFTNKSISIVYAHNALISRWQKWRDFLRFLQKSRHFWQSVG